ncbi:DUF916 and DUF3324 domain-containing protein [Lapidilactobacillus luobeiensis]|uniref:DUF916 and DUF3324 domain-containing protein n=1 Tax=Lapidilactobacillus luobeiensis TaxID=2950371 RepID=UPI0021C31332|nr:DUF916 and DUF3324 domain-containing protein [Lapidilactobacillus luobeiensis]
MKSKKLLALVLGLVTIFIVGMTTKPVAAQTSGSEFTISPVFSEEQNTKTDDYFSYTAQPQAVLPLGITIQNLSKTNTHKFEIRLVTATTSDQGKINYSPTKKKRDASAQTVLTDLVKDSATIKTITLKPGATQKVTYELTIPEDGIQGTVLGSVFVHRVDNENSQANIGIVNEFSMLVPVILKSANAPVTLPKLNIERVALDSTGGSAYLKTTIHNQAPVMFGKIKLVAAVTKRGQTKKLLTQTNENYEMAPNSILDYHVATTGKTLAPGKYTMHLKMSSGSHDFKMTKDFTIKANQRQSVEKTLQEDNRTRSRRWLWLIIGALILIIATLTWLLLRKRAPKQ